MGSGSGVLQLSIVKLQVKQWVSQSSTIYRWLAKVFNGEEHPRHLQSKQAGLWPVTKAKRNLRQDMRGKMGEGNIQRSGESNKIQYCIAGSVFVFMRENPNLINLINKRDS